MYKLLKDFVNVWQKRNSFWHQASNLFLNIGITLAILRREGNTPVEKERFTSFDRIPDRASWIESKISRGMLLGPEDLPFLEKKTFETSCEQTGLRKNDRWLGFFNHSENDG